VELVIEPIVIIVGIVAVSALGGHTPPDKGNEREETQGGSVHASPFDLSEKNVSSRYLRG
jgi:hypothetical protein